ncbi:hypothetical protein OKW18_005438 [Streptomyces pratensis]|nr:hypothetical protein [Streptomyces pratensis]
MNSGSVHAKKLEQHFLSARLATPHVQARHSARHMTKRAARIIRREMAHDSPPRAFSPSVVAAEPDAPPASFAYPDGYSTRRVRRSVRAAGFTQSLAVGKALARRRQGPYALERTTVRRRTGAAEFARLVEGRAVARTFAVDRVLTKGFAVVRGARRVRRGPDGSRSC